MKLKNVSHYAIYDQKFDNWKSEVLDRWTYDDFVRDPQYKKKWISITSLAYHQPSDAVYLGIGSFSAELLWKFDRKAKTITSCGYEKVGEPFDAKFHRSLELDGNTLYGGVAPVSYTHLNLSDASALCPRISKRWIFTCRRAI